MRKNSRVFAVNMVLIALSTIVQFFQNKFFVQYLGINELGLVRLLTQMLQYLNIIEAGLATASAYALYKPMADNNTAASGHLFHSIAKLYRYIITAYAIVGLLLTAILPFFVKGIPFSIAIAAYWWIYLLSSCIKFLQIKYKSVLTAGQHKVAVTLIPSLSQLLTRVLGLIVIVTVHSLMLYVITAVVGAIFEVITARRIFFKNYSELPLTDYDGKIEEELTISMKQLFWHVSAGAVVLATDMAVIAAVTNLRVVGIYASYMFVCNGLMQVMSSVRSLMTPGIGRLNATATKPEIFSHFQISNTWFMIVATVVSIVTFLLFPAFITLWLGSEFVLPPLSAALICFNLGVRLFRNNLDMYKATGGFFSDTHLPILEATMNLPLSIGLGIAFGLPGVLAATTFTNIIIILGEKPRLLYNKLFMSSTASYVRDYGVWTLQSAAVVAAGYSVFAVSGVTINSWMDFVGVGLILTLVLSAFGFAVALTRKDVRQACIEFRSTQGKGEKNEEAT